MSDSIKNKTINGIAWNAIDRVATYGISFIVSIVLARLLTPEDYGLIGIITIFIAIFNTILDGGFSTSLIRKVNASEKDYNTVFYTNLAISIVLAFLLYISSNSIAGFFNRKELFPLIKVMSVILIINAISITQQVQLTKKLDFKKQTIISLISNTVSGAIGIILAYKGYGVWALVFQQIISRFLNSILLFAINRWFPKLCFSRESFFELWSFGWKVLVSRVITSVWGNIYQAVIGKVYSPTILGLYTRAAQYGQMFSSGVSDVVLKVSLPVMSSVQDNRGYLLQVTRRIIKQTMFVTSLCMFGMIASAPTMIYVLIGEQWMDCVPFLQILCINLLINPICFINENLLTAIGRSDRLLILQIIKLVLSIIPLVCGILINIWWMLIGNAITSWVIIFFYSYYTNKDINYNWIMQFKDLIPSVIISFAMGVPVYALNFLQISKYLIFPFQIVVGILSVILICKIFKVEEFDYVYNIISEKIKRKNE